MKKITKEELEKILNNHKKWCEDECEDGKRAVLRDTDLSGINLKNIDLARADFSYSNLSGADLSGADLSDAELSGANLSSANLSSANLSGTNLIGAKLLAVSLVGAITDKKYLTISCIGSRRGSTLYCVEDDLVICGCWKEYKGDTLEEFEKRVETVYGIKGKTPNKQYYDEYTHAINFFKSFR